MSKQDVGSRHLLSVSSAVAADVGFDITEAVSYTIDNKFEGFQAYLNLQVLQSPEARHQIRTRCQQANIRLIGHAPATLTWTTVSEDSINVAARDLLAFEEQVLVVYHYDETVDTDHALACLEYLSNQGIFPCLENFFIHGAETSEQCFRAYLQLLLRANEAGIEVLPVFDIPRLYNENVDLAHISLNIIEDAFATFRQIGKPVIFHLIDVTSSSQERSSWCPIGQGIIPYEKIFKRLIHSEVSVYMTVLEYEDTTNPIASRGFFKTLSNFRL